MELITGADQRYFPGLRLGVLSALKSLHRERPCRCSVIDGGLAAESIALMERDFARVSRVRRQPDVLRFLRPDLERFRRLPSINGSVLTYCRLLAHDLLPDSDLAVWIDADVIVYRDLLPMAERLSGGTDLVGGVKDFFLTSADDCPEPDEPFDRHYLNAGVLAMNLAGMRERDLGARLLRQLDEWGEGLQYHEQTAVNFAARGRKQVWSPEYNYQVQDDDREELIPMIGAANLHTVKVVKPWHPTDPVRNVVRNLIFYQTLGLLTGADFRRELATLRQHCLRRRNWPARGKVAFYYLTGNVKRHRRHRRRYITPGQFSSWSARIDRNLHQWYASR